MPPRAAGWAAESGQGVRGSRGAATTARIQITADHGRSRQITAMAGYSRSWHITVRTQPFCVSRHGRGIYTSAVRQECRACWADRSSMCAMHGIVTSIWSRCSRGVLNACRRHPGAPVLQGRDAAKAAAPHFSMTQERVRSNEQTNHADDVNDAHMADSTARLNGMQPADEKTFQWIT